MAIKRGTKEHREMRSQMAKKQGFGQWGKGKKRPPFSEEWRRKIGDGQRGRKQSEETKRNHSIGAKKVGCGKWMKGKKLCKETCQKMSERKKGEKHPMWKHGKYVREKAPRPKPEECEVCGSMDVICYDHCHATNKFRGWICRRCNITLGMVKDNVETLVALAEYLKKSR